MMQWSMRITAYADRLLKGLETVDWNEPIKEMQRNWIGKSTGAEMVFQVKGQDKLIKVFTTRIDTIYGVTYLALAPEHD
jgi:leucyl-tRNA synthetase